MALVVSYIFAAGVAVRDSGAERADAKIKEALLN